MKKKLLALSLTAAMAMSLAACGQSADPAVSSSGSAASTPAGGEAYTVGIIQLVQHPALDAATQGFQDALADALGEAVTFDLQNASGDTATCSTMANQMVSSNVDLILANATPALQAAAAATNEIPILGTAVTEYGVAMGISDFTGTVGGNISGTSDLAPLDQQAAMVTELVPDAKTVGILYCSGEPNSVYQAEVVKTALEDAGLTVSVYTFADSNDVASVTTNACNDSDVIYIPTDNTAASCTEAINNVAQPAGVPIIAGEEGICTGCGVATLSIDYYELGRTTGEMAAKILTGESDISTMPIEYYANPVKKYDADRADALGVSIPAGYTAIEG